MSRGPGAAVLANCLAQRHRFLQVTTDPLLVARKLMDRR